MTTQSNIIDRFKNPALWLTILGVFVWITIRINSVDVNTKDIKILEDRVQKKIEMLNDLNSDFYQYKLEMKDHEIQMIKEMHRLELKLNSK